MAYPSDKSVRAAIKELIQPAAPTATILTRWTLGSIEDTAKWPGELKGSTGKTHGFVIIREDIAGEVSGSSIKGRLWTYTIFGLYEHFGGTDASNSEDIWNAEIDAIVAALDSLEGANIGNAKRKDAARFRLDQRKFGGVLHHTALGILTFEPCNT